MILETLRAIGRRWYIVLAGLLMTSGLAWGAYVSTPPQYTARALTLLLPGENAVGKGGNPLLALSGLEQPASIVVAYFASSAAKDELAKVSETAEFSVQLDDSTRGPVIATEASDKTESSALRVLSYLNNRVPQVLAGLQADVGAPATSVITSMPLTVDQKAKIDRGGTIRVTIAALAVGIVVTGIVAFAVDGLLLRRRLRRSRRLDLATGLDQTPEIDSRIEDMPAPREASDLARTMLDDDQLDTIEEEFSSSPHRGRIGHSS